MPSLNHSMLTVILRYSGFADCLAGFFSDYLVDRSTQYSWNSFLSNACDADVGMGQGLALFFFFFFLKIYNAGLNFSPWPTILKK